MSSSLLGALAGSAAAFVVGDKLGRKRELMLGAVLYGESAISAQMIWAMSWCFSLSAGYSEWVPMALFHFCKV